MKSHFVELLLACVLVGCGPRPPAGENIPLYPWAGNESAIHDLCARSHAVKTVSSEAIMTLTRPNGESVRLDGAVAMALPDSVRLRAWKFNQAVFDLTITPDGVWIESPPDPQHRQDTIPAGVNATNMARAWSTLFGEFFCNSDLHVDNLNASQIIVSQTSNGRRIQCVIDRATLTPRRYTVDDAAGVRRFTLTLSQYGLFGGTQWPTHLIADSDGGKIEANLHNVELNGSLPSAAFVPPKASQKLP